MTKSIKNILPLPLAFSTPRVSISRSRSSSRNTHTQLVPQPGWIPLHTVILNLLLSYGLSFIDCYLSYVDDKGFFVNGEDNLTLVAFEINLETMCIRHGVKGKYVEIRPQFLMVNGLDGFVINLSTITTFNCKPILRSVYDCAVVLNDLNTTRRIHTLVDVVAASFLKELKILI